MAKLPVEIIIKAIDKAGPAFKSLAARMKAAWGEGKFKAWYAFTALKEHLAANFKPLDLLKSGLMGAGAAIAGLGAGLVAAGAGFLHFIGSTQEALDSLNDLSSAAGLSVDTFAGLRYSAKLGGVDAESFATGIQKLNKSMGEMTTGKGGEFLAFLKQAAPDLAKQVKGAKTTEGAMSLLADAFAKLPDSQRRAALANAAFGKSGAQLGEWLHAGGPAVQKQVLRYLQLAGSQDAAAKAAGDLGDAWDDTQTALDGLRSAVASKFFPVLTDLANRLATFISENREGIAAWAERAAKALGDWVNSGGIERLTSSLDTMATAIINIATAVGPMVSSFTSALDPVVRFGTAVFEFSQKFLGFSGALESFRQFRSGFMQEWDTIRPVLEKMQTLLSFVTPGADLLLGGGIAQGNTLQSFFSPKAAGLAAATAGPGGGETRVVVDFANAPRGTRVSQESNGNQSVDLSVGYSMASGISG